MVNLDHPANRSVLAYLSTQDRLASSASAAKSVRSCSPSDVENPYYRLGTHPDLLERLWDQLGRILPKDCRWIVHGTPVLVHHGSGVIFAFAGGTQTYALRLPTTERAAALAAGAQTVHRYPAYPQLGIPASVLDLATIGDEWVLGGWRQEEPQWCRAAYNHAERLPKARTQRRDAAEP
jgi:hypothetical protein